MAKELDEKAVFYCIANVVHYGAAFRAVLRSNSEALQAARKLVEEMKKDATLAYVIEPASE